MIVDRLLAWFTRRGDCDVCGQSIDADDNPRLRISKPTFAVSPFTMRYCGECKGEMPSAGDGQ